MTPSLSAQVSSQKRIIIGILAVYALWSYSLEDVFIPEARSTLRQGVREQAQEDFWKTIGLIDPSVDNLATVSCPTFLENANKQAEAFTDPNDGFYHVPRTTTTRQFKVSVNVPAHHRWGIPLTWTLGEPREYKSGNLLLDTQIQSILYQAVSGSHVIHIVDSENALDESYYYTLLARSLASNFVVDSFYRNSNLVQLMRLCESLHFNGWAYDGYIRLHPLWKKKPKDASSKDLLERSLTIDHLIRAKGWLRPAASPTQLSMTYPVVLLLINTDGFREATEILAKAGDLISNRKVKHVLLTSRSSMATEMILGSLRELKAAGYQLTGMWGPRDGEMETPKSENPDDVSKRIVEKMKGVQSLTLLWSAASK